MCFVCVSNHTDESRDAGGCSLPDGVYTRNLPAKLWHLVNDPEKTAICWDASGDAIIIDEKALERQILSTSSAPSFTSDSFSSFVHQLSLYGFKRINPVSKDGRHPAEDGGNCHHFYNPNFRRSRPELVTSMRSPTVSQKAKLQAGLDGSCQLSHHQRVSGERGKSRDFCPGREYCPIR